MRKSTRSIHLSYRNYFSNNRQRESMIPWFSVVKSVTNHWFSNRNCVPSAYFLSKTHGLDGHFNKKQRVPMPCTYRTLAGAGTLRTPLGLKLEYLDLLLVNTPASRHKSRAYFCPCIRLSVLLPETSFCAPFGAFALSRF